MAIDPIAIDPIAIGFDPEWGIFQGIRSLSDGDFDGGNYDSSILKSITSYPLPFKPSRKLDLLYRFYLTFPLNDSIIKGSGQFSIFAKIK